MRQVLRANEISPLQNSLKEIKTHNPFTYQYEGSAPLGLKQNVIVRPNTEPLNTTAGYNYDTTCWITITSPIKV